MILDSSALVAILKDESDAAELLSIASGSASLSIGAPTLLETSIVVGPDRRGDLDELLAGLRVSAVDFGAQHVDAARDAYARFGRGSGSPARLNYGDVMSYAVAVVAGEALLFKGDDFTHTDVATSMPTNPG